MTGRYLARWEAEALGYKVEHETQHGVRSMVTTTGYLVAYGAPSYVAAVGRADTLILWHIGWNLRWLAEQFDRPARLPCGELTGVFLIKIADKLERASAPASCDECSQSQDPEGLGPDRDASAVPEADAQAPAQPPVNSGQPS